MSGPDNRRRDGSRCEVCYPLPKDTSETFSSYRGQCRNPGLWYERFVWYWPGWSLEPRKKGKDSINPKHETIKAVGQASCDAELLKAFVERWRKMVKRAGALTFEAGPDFRFVTGLGRGGPLEVGFAFHRIYGFPIIPGSSLKGLARSYALLCPEDVPEVRGETIKEREQDGLFQQVFGTQEGAGSAIFFDAVPLTAPRLEVDIMNCHYPDYYQGQKPPADWQSPIPVFFLTVGKGAEFLFAVGGRGPDGEASRQKGWEWLRAGLKTLGAGAKTAAGYGYFE